MDCLRISISFILLISLLSCKKSSQGESFKHQEKKLLTSVINEYGGAAFYKSTVSFDVGDLKYNIFRNDNILNSELIRKVDDVVHKATYSNGYIQYYIDSILQRDGDYRRLFLDVKLDAFVYLLSIPHVLSGTDVKLTKKESVKIRKKEYTVLHVAYKVNTSDIPDELYLYINEETNRIEFMSELFKLSGSIPKFKKYYNFRKVNGILFADYYVMRDERNETAVGDIYKLYQDASLKQVEHIQLNNIKVTPSVNNEELDKK